MVNKKSQTNCYKINKRTQCLLNIYLSNSKPGIRINISNSPFSFPIAHKYTAIRKDAAKSQHLFKVH